MQHSYFGHGGQLPRGGTGAIVGTTATHIFKCEHVAPDAGHLRRSCFVPQQLHTLDLGGRLGSAALITHTVASLAEVVSFSLILLDSAALHISNVFSEVQRYLA